jgi:two-component system sensor histidine kinase ArlS
MTKKLLPRTLRIYMVYALALLLIGAPLFYIITQRLYVDDTNEALMLSKANFIKNTLPVLKVKDIESFNRISWNIKIIDFEKSITGDMFQYRTFMDSIENENETYRVLLSPVRIENKPYTIMVRMNMIEKENLVKSIAIVFLALIVILLAGLFLITLKLSQNLWRPFYNSLEQIEAFRIDDDHMPKWQTTSVEEFARLNQAVNKLIERNIAIYSRQREFVETAAHELQTPLAAFRAKLDNLMQISSINKEQAIILDDLLLAVNRLTRLNKNLLLLSKLDAGLFKTSENISIGKTLEKQIQLFMGQAQVRKIDCEFDLQDDFFVEANFSLVESIAGNLLLNAIRHNNEKGKIMVHLSDRKLILCNTGSNAPLDHTMIFERFSRSQPSRSGNGLGLAIVKKICGLYGWHISYSWENGLHCFTLDFKNSKFLQNPVLPSN